MKKANTGTGSRKFRKVYTLQQVKNDPRVAEVWTENNDGRDYWAALKEGYINGEAGTHTLHEWSVRRLCEVLNFHVRECTPIEAHNYTQGIGYQVEEGLKVIDDQRDREGVIVSIEGSEVVVEFAGLGLSLKSRGAGLVQVKTYARHDLKSIQNGRIES